MIYWRWSWNRWKTRKSLPVLNFRFKSKDYVDWASSSALSTSWHQHQKISRYIIFRIQQLVSTVAQQFQRGGISLRQLGLANCAASSQKNQSISPCVYFIEQLVPGKTLEFCVFSLVMTGFWPEMGKDGQTYSERETERDIHIYIYIHIHIIDYIGYI